MGSVFYFVTFDGTLLSKELIMSYTNVELKLKEKQKMITRMLKLQPECRPSVEKLLHHPFFWEDKRCLNFILDIRKNFDILDPKFVRKIKGGMKHQFVLQETTIVRRLKVTLDSDKLVIHNNWKEKLDAVLADEFNKGYDKESVSDLLRAMRNKVIIPLNSSIFLY